jgi:hypothetical protein
VALFSARPGFQYNRFGIAEIIGNNIIVFGRCNISTNWILLSDIFDLQLHKIRTDTIGYCNGGGPVKITYIDGRITYFWSGMVNTSQFEFQLFAKQFSSIGTVSVDSMPVLPYFPGLPPYTVNLNAISRIVPFPSGKSCVIWNFSDAEKTGNQYSVYANPTVRALWLDKTLSTIGTPETLIANDNSHRLNTVTKAQLLDNGNVFVEYWNSTGGWDYTEIWKCMIYDSLLNPTALSFVDTLQYIKTCFVNDSTIFKFTTNPPAIGTFVSLKSAIPVTTTMPKVVSSHYSQCIISKFQNTLIVQSTGENRIILFSCSGKFIANVGFTDKVRIDLSKYAHMVLVAEVRKTCNNEVNGMKNVFLIK